MISVSYNNSEMPQDKLLKHGVNSLDPIELLSLILRSGTPTKSVTDICKTIFEEYSLNEMGMLDLDTFKTFEGIGDAKACQILATFELCSRLGCKTETEDSPKLCQNDKVDMDRNDVLRILLALANGINPDTGDVFEGDSPYQSLNATRALFWAIRELEANSANNQHALQAIPKNIGRKDYSHDGSTELVSKTESKLPEKQDDSIKKPETVAEDNKHEIRKGFQPPPLDDVSQILFESLKEWRLTVSREKGSPAYTVLSNKALSHIAYLKPTSLDTLLEAHGVGDSKIEQYGEDILNIVSQTLTGNDQDIVNRDDDIAPF